MKVKAGFDQSAFDRAFGHMPKKELNSEWYVHKSVAKYLKEKYPDIRFYSTLDGFNLGKQRSLVSSLQWFTPGVPDLFIFHNNGTHSMLVVELKKDGIKVGKDEHTKRQQGWLTYLQSQGARAEFAIGYKQAIALIESHINPKANGKEKRK
jgi:hypothetical protein